MKRRLRRLLFVAGCMCLLGVIVYVAGLYFQSTQTVTVDGDCYHYALGQKDVYEGSSKLNYEDGRVIIQNGRTERPLSSAPVYCEDGNRLLLTASMSYVRPVTDVFDYRVNYFTEFFTLDGTVYMDSRSFQGAAGQAFLYDGKDTYVFLEPVTVTWRDQIQHLDTFSYAVVTYGQKLELYIRQEDAYRTESIGTGATVRAQADGYTIDLGLDILTRNGERELLFSEPGELDEYKG